MEKLLKPSAACRSLWPALQQCGPLRNSTLGSLQPVYLFEYDNFMYIADFSLSVSCIHDGDYHCNGLGC